MPIETERNRHTAEHATAPFAASQQLIPTLTGADPALDQLHRNTRALFARERNMERTGMFHDLPRHFYFPDER